MSRLGAGGMGVVYKARDTRLGRLVALKFLSPHALGDARALERFRLEARAASALNHPNICTIYDIGECEYGTFIAMELLEGRSLRDDLRAGPSDAARLLKLAVQLADALQAAHTEGIVHRDIKPENIFVVSGDRLKVLDFGLAKLHAAHPSIVDEDATTRTAETALTQLGIALGTTAYMSPEQARAENVDSRTDLFSFGAVLFEMAARRRAFHGANAAETHVALLTQTPVLPPSVRASFRVPLQAILDKALEKNRDLRYQHASDLGADLKRLQRDLATPTLTGVQPAVPSTASGRSLATRLIRDLARAAALTVMLFLAYGYFDSRPSGRHLNQFQISLVQETLHGGVEESDFEAGGRRLPLVVDISALHPEKRQATNRALLDAVIDRLLKRGARAIGIDLSFDDLRATDFQYFDRWVKHGNVRVGVYSRAVQRRDAWLGRPEFSSLAAGIALSRDNPQQAFAYTRRWFPSAPTQYEQAAAPDCAVPEPTAGCKEDLIQLPVALWLLLEKQDISAQDPASEEVETRLRRLLDSRQPNSAEPRVNGIDFGTYVIDYSYLRDLRQEIVTLPPPDDTAGLETVMSHIDAHASTIADRAVLVGDLEDTSDQLCQTQGMKPLSGVLVHACALATLNRGTLLESSGSLGHAAAWGLAVFLIAIIVALRLSHAMWWFLGEWPYHQLEILVFVCLSAIVMLSCRWVARVDGIVWPNFLWVAGGLALYPFVGLVGRAFLTAPRLLWATSSASGRRFRGA